jgi:polysaccharide pyruvyl transferase WcaK-like protein
VFDTSVATLNLGDEIIMDAVLKEMAEVFRDHMVLRSLTHDRIGPQTYGILKDAEISFLGGTNLLSSEINRYRQWSVGYCDIARGLSDVVLFGVGWWQYQRAPNMYTRLFLKLALSSKWIHSVRDSYAVKMLEKAGITNVVNTGCPTMWRLTPDHCASIPRAKAQDAVFTLTDYKKSPDHDLKFIHFLSEHYRDIYFWPQGRGDIKYLNSLTDGEELKQAITVVPPSLKAFDSLLSDTNVNIDFVGTRLHAGIRAMQHKRRAIILAVDNRATEKATDFQLPVVDRASLAEIEQWVLHEFDTKILLPVEAIESWKSQFR